MFTTEQLVARFIELRDEKTQINDEAKAKLAAVAAGMDAIEAELKTRLDAAGGTGLKTKAGSVSTKTVRSYSTSDSGVFMDFVRESNNVDLLQSRLSTTALKEFLDAGNAVPPGISIDDAISIVITRPRS